MDHSIGSLLDLDERISTRSLEEVGHGVLREAEFVFPSMFFSDIKVLLLVPDLIELGAKRNRSLRRLKELLTSI